MGLNGLLLVNKPTGITSHDVVGRVRRALRQREVGHTGTLDPLASGLMVLVLGEATKISDYLAFSDKSYRLRALLGMSTDTLDVTGTVTSRCAVDLSQEAIQKAAQSLQGAFDWPVPIFSAAKVAGKKLYEYGRAGLEVACPIKRMEFSDVLVHDIQPDSVEVSLQCSKGSFVRSWCAELGNILGVGGCLQQLHRTSVGPYLVSQASQIEDIDESFTCDSSAFVPISATLPHWRSVYVPGKEERLLMNGQIPRDLANRLIVEQKEAFRRNEPIGIKVLGDSGRLISILMAQPGNGLKIRRVFRLDASVSSH